MSVSENFPDISFIDGSTVDEIQAQMINDYREKYKELTGEDVSLAAADPYRLIMYACTAQIYQAMQYADFAGKMSFLKYSRGDYLDNLAALRGVERIQSTAAVTTLQFSINAPIESVVAIPAGTRVTNGNDVFFATDEYAEIGSGETTVTVSATCTTTGAEGNGFAPGEFSTLVNTLPYITAVTNTDVTAGGSDIEDDESLKDRIFNAPSTYTTTGTAAAYEYHVKSVDTSISDVMVQSTRPGTVEVYFILDGGEIPSDSLIEKVSEYLMDNNIRPLTDNVVVQAPATEEYDVEFTYYISSSDKVAVSTIQADVETAVSIYNTWQTEKIGRDINPDYLLQKVMEAGAKRVTITSPSFMVLEKNTAAKVGTVTARYGGVEDD